MNRRSQVHRFVIVTGQRSGSTMLVKSLDSSPHVFCAGEIFHPGANVYHREFQFPHALAKNNPLVRFWNALRTRGCVKRHLDRFYEDAGAGVSAVGFKLMTSQTRTFPWLMKMLRECDVTPVYLLRKDVIATAISYYKAKATGRFHSDRTGDSQQQPGALSIDDAEFGRIVKICRENKHQLERLHTQNGGLLLAYEDMVGDWRRFVRVIGEKIGLPGLEVEMAIAKLKPGTDSAQLGEQEEATLRERFGECASG